MKLKFKHQPYQAAAVQAVVDIFKGQPLASAAAMSYRLDPGNTKNGMGDLFAVDTGFKNAELILSEDTLQENIQLAQRQQNLPLSDSLVKTKVAGLNLDIEMETGTGKTYCYIKTIFELNKQYGWSKFVIVVPSIAIREGVAKSFDITAEHFQETYHKKARFFIYNSKQLHQLESFSSDAGINVKHVYFVAETKGSMSSLDLRPIEATKIRCARKFFYEINKKFAPENVKYDVVDSFGKLMEVVK